MTLQEAHHLWIRFVGIDNVADTLREEFDALPCDLLDHEDQLAAQAFLLEWVLCIMEMHMPCRP